MQALRSFTKVPGLFLITGLLLLGSSPSWAGGAYSGAGTTAPAKHPAKITSGKLDGKTFVVQLVESGKSPMTDSLIFKNGRFESTACRTFGFGQAGYSVNQARNTETFMARTYSAKQGIMLWKGTITNNRIQGTVVQTMKGQAKPVEFTFSGSLPGTEHVSTGVAPK